MKPGACEMCVGCGRLVAGSSPPMPWVIFTSGTSSWHAVATGHAKSTPCPSCGGSGLGPDAIRAELVEKAITRQWDCITCWDLGWHHAYWRGTGRRRLDRMIKPCPICQRYDAVALKAIHDLTCGCGAKVE